MKKENRSEVVNIRVTPSENIAWSKYNKSELIREAVNHYLTIANKDALAEDLKEILSDTYIGN